MINPALDIAAHMEDSIDSLANEFSLDTVLVEQASGYSELKKPEESLRIYKETDKLRPFRPLREPGSYTITKAQALLNTGDLDQGIALGLKGIQMASEYQSKRQILWLDKTYNQLRLLPIGKDKRLNILKDALDQSKHEQALWWNKVPSSQLVFLARKGYVQSTWTKNRAGNSSMACDRKLQKAQCPC